LVSVAPCLGRVPQGGTTVGAGVGKPIKPSIHWGASPSVHSLRRKRRAWMYAGSTVCYHLLDVGIRAASGTALA